MLICMDKKRKKYEVLPFALKRKVIEDLDAGILTRSKVMEMYNIKSDTTLSNWRKQLKRGKKKTYRYISPETKIKKVNEILLGLKTEEQVQKELDLTSIYSIKQWIEKYRHTSQQTNETVVMADNNSSDKENSDELQQARLKILALESLISTAEKELNYTIRKKYGTKQLKK